MGTEFEPEWQKGKDKEFTRLFWNISDFRNISMFRTSEHGLFPTCHALITWFELSRVKLYRNELKGNKNYFELARGSSYRGFELQRVKLQWNCKKEIQGKSTLVRVSARFQLARVRVIGSQLYHRAWVTCVKTNEKVKSRIGWKSWVSHK